MKRFFYWLALLLCVAVFGFCAWQIWGIVSEYNAGTSLYEETATQFVTVLEPESEASDPGDSSGADTAAESGTAAADETGDGQSDSAPISVDFDALLAANPDVVGWLYCPDTVINYPILQGASNDTYLHHMVDGSYNSSGSIFLDYRNASDFSDANSIVYGHNMKNESMFGTLDKYKKQSYYDEHPVLWLLTPTASYRLDIIGGCVLDADSDFYNSLLWGDDVESQIDYILSHSTFDADAEWDGESTVISLSTCSYEYDDARYVVLCVPVSVG
ncbi:MAG: class B sortase [Clostridiales bacterium]|nr:class B sortase [Clostridiales bacterium]